MQPIRTIAAVASLWLGLAPILSSAIAETPDPAPASKRADKSWWSLQPLGRPPIPEASQLLSKAGHLVQTRFAHFDLDVASWMSNPVDRFVLPRLLENDLLPSPPADARTLLRRLSYDLTGLPPTPDEVEAFAASAAVNRPQTIQRWVDRLLASPHYGERWGRHWLDVVRFGESNGFERNFIIDEAWPFRDYVIRSFNEDKPFNRFIVEHLAGDIIGKDQPDVEIGVAFLTIGPYDDVGNQDAVAAANIRAATVDDMVATAAAAFLGLTVNCARCHHHKFDPIPTEDYYRLKAAFDGVSHGHRSLSTPEERQRTQSALQPMNDRKSKLTDEKRAMEKALLSRSETFAEPVTPRPIPSAHLTEEKFPAVAARFVRLTMLAGSDNPKSAVGARIDEFEVWSSSEPSRNVALAAEGGSAQGSFRVARDFEGAYDVKLVNDGKFSAAWIVGHPAILTITLPRSEMIDRISFSWDRVQMSDLPIAGRGPSVVEYEIHVSEDNRDWRKVADSFDRKPFGPAHARERRLRATITPEDTLQLENLSRQIAAVDAEIAKVPKPKPVWVGSFAQPAARPVVFRGGDPAKPGSEIKPGSLSVLDQTTESYELASDAPESERRLSLAGWIASDANPLTARVLANRVWQHHFGVGIVDTPSDFGFLGSRPTHPALLDWLARRLHDHGWRLKALHREILLSQAYQQASQVGDRTRSGDSAPSVAATALRVARAAQVDSDNRLFWRFPPRRLSAEEVRDTLLGVAGRLDLRMGGPGFRLYEHKSDNVSTYMPLDQIGPDTYRRSVYHQNVRASVVDVLSDFDLPDNAFPVPKRSKTTTPLQALSLLNHSFTLDLANALAQRLVREAGPEADAQVIRAYRIAFQREPSDRERAAAVNLVRTYGLPAFGRGLFNANELVYLD